MPEINLHNKTKMAVPIWQLLFVRVLYAQINTACLPLLLDFIVHKVIIFLLNFCCGLVLVLPNMG